LSGVFSPSLLGGVDVNDFLLVIVYFLFIIEINNFLTLIRFLVFLLSWNDRNLVAEFD